LKHRKGAELSLLIFSVLGSGKAQPERFNIRSAMTMTKVHAAGIRKKTGRPHADGLLDFLVKGYV
jgi:hypothetical protein